MATLSSTCDATIASDAGSNATVGNTTGTSTVEGSDINIGPAGPGTIDIGNAGSTTTLDGTVVFTNPPSLPLADNAIFVGDGTNVAAAYATRQTIRARSYSKMAQVSRCGVVI